MSEIFVYFSLIQYTWQESFSKIYFMVWSYIMSIYHVLSQCWDYALLLTGQLWSLRWLPGPQAWSCPCASWDCRDLTSRSAGGRPSDTVGISQKPAIMCGDQIRISLLTSLIYIYLLSKIAAKDEEKKNGCVKEGRWKLSFHGQEHFNRFVRGSHHEDLQYYKYRQEVVHTYPK